MTLDLEPIYSKGAKYTEADIDQALLALALSGGSSAVASKRLKEQGAEIPEKTLRNWRENQYPKRYAHLQQKYGAELEELAVRGIRSNLLLADQLERDMLEDFAGSYKSLDAKDKAGAIRNIATTKAINADKLLQLTGRPTQTIEHRNASDLLAQIAQRVGLPAIEGTAEEITEATAH